MVIRIEAVFVVIIVKKQNCSPQVLLQLRESTGLHDGKYGFPGGKREGDEPLLGTAIREVNEELDIKLYPSDLLKLRSRKGMGEDGKKWTCHFYLVTLSESRLNDPQLNEPDKHREIRWYHIDNLPKNIVPVVYEVIKQIPERSIRIARQLKYKE